MNKNKKRLQAEFGPEIRFKLRPTSATPFRANAETAFERLKNALLSERLDVVLEPQSNSALRRAANEAAALAWVTPYPLLVFPALFEEKVQAALDIAQRQENIRVKTRDLLVV